MGDTIKTFFRNGSLRKQSKPIRPVQSLPYTTAASGAPPRHGLAPLKGDISPATHGIWTSTIETFDQLDSQAEQKHRKPQTDVAQNHGHSSTNALTTAEVGSPIVQGHDNGQSYGAEATSDLGEEVDWDHTIGIALTTDHVKYIEHVEGVDRHRGVTGRAHPVWEDSHPPVDLTWDSAAQNKLDEMGANKVDFFFDLQAALDKASDYGENQPRHRKTSRGIGAEAHRTDASQSQALPMGMEI
ncbi:uncharacterized protein J3D65DRAFT_403310 [Phyllosticta citribraziliensis]|uniref:Uncharacterized protein n=1 Tax=Phyllosticta citribraziliensis TaxID=989973 RepID=A0ABR1LLL3_9PEZI